jgi:hypothetical protein
MTGRINSNGSISYAGAPSGVSSGVIDGTNRTLAPSVDRTARNLAVELEGNVTGSVTVRLTPFVGGLRSAASDVWSCLGIRRVRVARQRF